MSYFSSHKPELFWKYPLEEKAVFASQPLSRLTSGIGQL